MSDDFVLHDLEWTDDAENEPTELWGCGGCGAMWPLSHLRERGCPDCHADREWARALMEEDEEEVDKFTERDEAPMVKPTGPCVTLPDANGVEWKL